MIINNIRTLHPAKNLIISLTPRPTQVAINLYFIITLKHARKAWNAIQTTVASRYKFWHVSLRTYYHKYYEIPVYSEYLSGQSFVMDYLHKLALYNQTLQFWNWNWILFKIEEHVLFWIAWQRWLRASNIKIPWQQKANQLDVILYPRLTFRERFNEVISKFIRARAAVAPLLCCKAHLGWKLKYWSLHRFSATWFLSGIQIHQDLNIPTLTENTRALAEGTSERAAR